ncbi:hypothetical protein G9A89_010567 [Geosiphon pyriformis]|nr:hypothetical protein G9A89_010567 [Geosiphon pyriformis]
MITQDFQVSGTQIIIDEKLTNKIIRITFQASAIGDPQSVEVHMITQDFQVSGTQIIIDEKLTNKIIRITFQASAIGDPQSVEVHMITQDFQVSGTQIIIDEKLTNKIIRITFQASAICSPQNVEVHMGSCQSTECGDPYGGSITSSYSGKERASMEYSKCLNVLSGAKESLSKHRPYVFHKCGGPYGGRITSSYSGKERASMEYSKSLNVLSGAKESLSKHRPYVVHTWNTARAETSCQSTVCGGPYGGRITSSYSGKELASMEYSKSLNVLSGAKESLSKHRPYVIHRLWRSIRGSITDKLKSSARC